MSPGGGHRSRLFFVPGQLVTYGHGCINQQEGARRAPPRNQKMVQRLTQENETFRMILARLQERTHSSPNLLRRLRLRGRGAKEASQVPNETRPRRSEIRSLSRHGGLEAFTVIVRAARRPAGHRKGLVHRFRTLEEREPARPREITPITTHHGRCKYRNSLDKLVERSRIGP
jgi:hypothetical protein